MTWGERFQPVSLGNIEYSYSVVVGSLSGPVS